MICVRKFLLILPFLIYSLLYPAVCVSQQHEPNLRLRLAGTRKAADCERILRSLQEELLVLHYPSGWTIEVSCTTVAWQIAWRKAGAPPTTTAFTQPGNRITVLNGEIFRMSAGKYRKIIAHELAHIRCQCNGEYAADKIALQLMHQKPEPLMTFTSAAMGTN
jgi:hypothetical protein